MAGVTLRGIVKRYGTAAPTLTGIDLDIRDGEFLVLVGPSGCGKSTLLRIIAGLESITEGELSIGDRVVNQVAPKDRDIAMVFQSYALYPHMTVRRNMSFGLEVRRESSETIDKLVGEAARLLGLDDQLDKLPKMLSGGQRQRVAMGRAIVRRPKVFLFDEPLSNLDAALRTQMRVEIRLLHQTLKTTTVYVTHDQVEAMTLADRIAVLHRGVLQQVGSPHELFRSPRNRFVAGFIGSPAMNFLDGTVRSEGADDAVDVGRGGKVPLSPGLGLSKKSGIGGALVLGVRPHDVSLVGAGEGELQGTVKVVETLGWESHVHLEVGGVPFLASVEAAAALKVRPGDAVGLRIPADAVHLFGKESGEALLHGATRVEATP